MFPLSSGRGDLEELAERFIYDVNTMSFQVQDQYAGGNIA